LYREREKRGGDLLTEKKKECRKLASKYSIENDNI
jgi:hypothetical protein